MTVHLVRHAKAGSRQRWDGPDDQRPVSKRGEAQSAALAARLAGQPIEQVFSSPYLRCVQTVEPLAARLGTAVERADGLAEGAPLAEALRLLEKVGDRTVVLCTHGDVLGDLIDHAERHGVRLDGEGYEKGCTWELELEAGAIVSARYVPAPS